MTVLYFGINKGQSSYYEPLTKNQQTRAWALWNRSKACNTAEIANMLQCHESVIEKFIHAKITARAGKERGK